MLLSRAFCLILGTTLFVLIWTMQDGNHRSNRVARSSRSQFAGQSNQAPEVQAAKVKTVSVSLKTPVVEAATPSVKKSAESMLWMFADEPAASQATQVAGR